jgi:hypothetical protein
MAKRKMAKRKKGKRRSLLVLLTLLIGYGAWNYQRNLEAESKLVRPYRSYSDEQLAQLIEAYAGQAGALEARYERQAKRRTGAREVGAIGEGIDQFAAVQRASRKTRELGAQLSQEEASVGAIRDEQAYRATTGAGVQAFLRRAFLPPN